MWSPVGAGYARRSRRTTRERARRPRPYTQSRILLLPSRAADDTIVDVIVVAARAAARAERTLGALHVLLVLEQHGQRIVERLFVERVRIERDERARPIDGLAHAG